MSSREPSFRKPINSFSRSPTFHRKTSRSSRTPRSCTHRFDICLSTWTSSLALRSFVAKGWVIYSTAQYVCDSEVGCLLFTVFHPIPWCLTWQSWLIDKHKMEEIFHVLNFPQAPTWIYHKLRCKWRSPKWSFPESYFSQKKILAMAKDWLSQVL